MNVKDKHQGGKPILVRVIREPGKKPRVVFTEGLGYKEKLLAQIQAETILLGKTPTAKDINKASKEKRTASSLTFMRIFRTFNLALLTAGFRPNRKIYYPARVLVEQLRQEAELLGKTPTKRDINRAAKAGRAARVETFLKRVGSFDVALWAAGLKPRFKSYTKEELIIQLQDEAKLLGKTPRIIDVDKAAKKGRIASAGTLKDRFGSYNNAIRAAGLKPNYSHYFRFYSMRDLVEQLQEEARRLGRIPKTKDINQASKEGRTACACTFIRYFGSFKKAVKAVCGN